MAHYDFYRHSQAGWGTPGFQGVPPPAPLYQPQPNWSGLDYYRAHSGLRDDNIFDYIRNKVRNFVTGTGEGLEYAIHWWKRVYGGLVDPSLLRARELGAAAAYEAFRIWETHQGIFAAPLAEDRERQREAISSIAAAEATKLWVHTRRPSDKYGKLEASEVAAATASRVFLEVYDSYEHYHGSPRFRRRSISASRYGVAGDIYDDDIQPDVADVPPPPRFRRGRSIHRSLSPSPYGGRAFSPSPYIAGNNLVAPQPVRSYSRSPSPMSVASAPGSPVMDSAFRSRRLRSPIPGGGYRSMTPMRYGSPPPAFWDTGTDPGLSRARMGLGPEAYGGRWGVGRPGYGAGVGLGPEAYGGGLGVGRPGYGAGVGPPGGLGGTGMMSSLTSPALSMLGANETNVTYDPVLEPGISSLTSPALSMLGANETNVTYDPLLGPGVRGTYYPEAASRAATLGASMDMGIAPRMGSGYRALPGGYGEYGTGGLESHLGIVPDHYFSAPGTFGRYGHRRGTRTFGAGMGRRHRYGY